MKWFFSDRLAPWSFMASLALFSLLVTSTNRSIEREFTDFRRCLALPESHHGNRVRILGAEFLDESHVRYHEIEIRISPIPGARPGMRLDAFARFDRSGDFIVETHEVYSYSPVKRILMYAISLPVLIVVLILFARRFRSRLPEGLFQTEAPENA